MYKLFKSHQERRSPFVKERNKEDGRDVQYPRDLVLALDALLEGKQEAIAPPNNKKDLPFVRRDSYSTITTAAETPELSIPPALRRPTPPPQSNSTPQYIYIRRNCSRESEGAEEEFAQKMSSFLQKAKYLPDPLTACDFDVYNDGSFEDIVFVPSTEDNGEVDEPVLSKEQKRIENQGGVDPFAQQKPTKHSVSTKATDDSRPSLRRRPSGGLGCLLPPVRTCQPPFQVTRIEI